MALPDSQGNDLYVPHCVDIPGISLDIYERNTWFGTPGPQSHSTNRKTNNDRNTRFGTPGPLQIMITGQSAMEQNKITNKSKQIGATTCNI